MGSLGVDILSDALVCLTAAGAESKVVNGSGRLSFANGSDAGSRSIVPKTFLADRTIGIGVKFRPFLVFVLMQSAFIVVAIFILTQSVTLTETF